MNLFKIAITLLILLSAQQLMAQVLRPQYEEHTVSITSNDAVLHGTVALPAVITDKPLPVVLFIAGSGPTDRNGNNKAGLNTNAYQMFCRQLTEKGIATLRYDKWGAGESMPTSKEIPASRKVFEAEIDDVVAWVKYIQTDKRFSELIIVGHSQGSLVGILAAQKTHPYTTKFISIAGLGYSGSETIKRQLSDPGQPAMLINDAIPVIDSLVSGHFVTNIPPLLTQLFNRSLQPYLISWFKYDPAQEFAKLNIPSLIIQGTNDIQVTIEDAKRLASARPLSSLLIIEQMNHVLKTVKGDRMENLASYSKPALPLTPELIEKVYSFIVAR